MASPRETNMTSLNANGTLSETQNLDYDITEKTHFKKGETLRLNVQLWGVLGVSGACGYGVDPADRDDSAVASGSAVISNADTTASRIAIPFVLDI